MTINWLEESITRALKRGPATVPQLAQITGVHRPTIRSRLDCMAQSGTVICRRTEGDRSMVWELVR